MNRRRALVRMGGLAAAVAGELAPWPRTAGAVPAAAPVFPPGAVIRTLFGDLRPGTLAGGTTLFHEHLNLPSTLPPDQTAAMVRSAMSHGVRCIVDGGHADMQRSVAVLRDISRQTGVHVVGSAGYHYERFHPPELARLDEAQIAEGLVREVRQEHLGAFGEIAESNDGPMTALEQKVFRAVGRAHVLTGLPIFTHTAYGTGPRVPKDAGLRQLDLLERAGVDPRHVAIGHLCCHDEPDAATLKAIAKRGAFVGFDRVTGGLVPDAQKVRTIQAFLDAGYAEHLLLSTDFTGKRTANGAGEVPMSTPLDYAITLTTFVPKLRAAGVPAEILRAITQDNPRRFLAFVPRSAGL